MATAVETVRGEAAPVARAEPVAGGLRFDWVAVALAGWLIGGLHLDGWAHNHHPEMESFFTPWHGVLYSGFFALFGFLFIAGAGNWRRGHHWRRALPAGYGLSFGGGVVFLAGGLLDMLWHLVLGIEANVEALLSPPHLLLALGATLLISGPLRAGWQRPAVVGQGGARWPEVLPALLSLTLVLALFAFFTQFAHPQVDLLATLRPEGQPVRGELFAMRADGSGQMRLTIDPDRWSMQAAPSPDGRRLAFVAGRGDAFQIYAMDRDGGNRVRLTDSKGAHWTPAWSPDGRRIAFTSSRDGNLEIYAMNADGGDQVRLTTAPGTDFDPVWSPDGRRIAFQSERQGSSQIYVMDADGANQTRLTTSGRNFNPSWSPDGARIAFASERDGHGEIYAMNADGSEQTRLTTTAGKGSNLQPAWSPDGHRIAFVSDRDQNSEIYAMNADGSDQTNLTRSAGTEDGQLPRWLPDGTGLLYTAQGHPQGSGWHAQGLGIAAILVQTALLMGAVLLALRRWMLPFGAFALVFGLSSLLISFMKDRFALIPAALAAGLAADLLLRLLRPSTRQPTAFHTFAFLVPFTYYWLYFLTLGLTVGLEWTVHVWAGTAVMAGVVGVVLSYLIVPAVPWERGSVRA